MKNDEDDSGIELNEGDAGVVYRANGGRVGFSDSTDPTQMDLTELYTGSPSPSVLAALALVLPEDDDRVVRARALLADWLMENVINDETPGVPN